MECRTALSRSRLPDLDYSLNPYVGCEHGCIYCYGRSMLRRSEALSWGNFVKVKRNIARVLAREVKVKPKGIVGVSTVTDPYQPVEAEYRLTRRCIEILSEAGFHVSIQTKSNLLLRDLDLIRPENFDVGVTITTMDRGLACIIEPKAPPPEKRVEVLEAVSALGAETWLFLGPIIPGVNDDTENLERIVEIARKTRSELIYDKLNLRRWVYEAMNSALSKNYDRLATVVFNKLTDVRWWKEVSEQIRRLCRRKGVTCEPAFKT